MPDYQLAQLNIAVPVAPLDSPIMAEFMNNLDLINTIADQSPGFVWRLQTEDGNATSLRPFGDNTMVNMSVWNDIDSFKFFVYKTQHTEFMRKRKQWFKSLSEAYLVMWWVSKGHVPDVGEAKTKLEQIRKEGPTEQAFNIRQTFAPPNGDS